MSIFDFLQTHVATPLHSVCNSVHIVFSLVANTGITFTTSLTFQPFLVPYFERRIPDQLPSKTHHQHTPHTSIFTQTHIQWLEAF